MNGGTLELDKEGIRINKYLSESGVCSRREADRQIALGNISIDGRTAGVGDRVLPGQQVLFCGQEIQKEKEEILLLVHKPVGIVCTAEKREKNNIVDYLSYPKRIYPVGRLDKDSSGLLLMTNQGNLVNKIMRAGNMHEKEYLVTVNKPLTQEFLRGMAQGVPIKELSVMTRKCLVEEVDSKTFRIVLTQGINRQIRRMCEYFNYRVVALQRIRIMNLKLGDLKPGTYREISARELTELKKQLQYSASTPVRPASEPRWGVKGKPTTSGKMPKH
ncbi:MAG: 23S rRNA pseudouridine(2604) synthase RluF [Lachnospiraceae bacterium]|nr:23S rRNA pseudouridine(2604) synthase RluF [Lachnospiraceae bacterium]